MQPSPLRAALCWPRPGPGPRPSVQGVYSYHTDESQRFARTLSEMTEGPVWEAVGASVVHLYHQHFDLDRRHQGALCTQVAHLSWEGEQFQGKAAIMGKLLNGVPFQKIHHIIVSHGHHPAPNNPSLLWLPGS